MDQKEKDYRVSPRKIALPGFILDQNIGLGDVISRATSAFGIEGCNSCNQRAQKLNSWLVFTKTNV